MSAFVGQEMASGESPGSGSRGLDQEQGLEPGPDAPPFRTWKRNERLVYLTNFVHMTMYTMCFGGIFDIFLYHLSQNQQVLVTNSITVGGGHSAVPSVLSVNTHSEFELTFEIKPGLQALYPSNSSCWQTFTCATSVMHITDGSGNGDCCKVGNRMPFVFFPNGSTKLHISMDAVGQNESLDRRSYYETQVCQDTKPLPLDEWATVKVKASGLGMSKGQFDPDSSKGGMIMMVNGVKVCEVIGTEYHTLPSRDRAHMFLGSMQRPYVQMEDVHMPANVEIRGAKYGKPASNLFVGIVNSIQGILSMLLMYPIGWLGDFFNRYTLLRLNVIVAALAGSVMIGAVYYSNTNLLFCGIILFTWYQQFISSIIYAVLADNVVRERRTNAGVNYKTFSALAMSLGPAIQLIVILVGPSQDNWSSSTFNILLLPGWLLLPFIGLSISGMVPVGKGLSLLPNTDEANLSKPIGGRTVRILSQAWLDEPVVGSQKRGFVVALAVNVFFIGTLLANGMTVRYFSLYFTQVLKFSPAQLCLLNAICRLFIAAFAQLGKPLAVLLGRTNLAIVLHIGSALFTLGIYGGPLGAPGPLVACACYLMRFACLHARDPVLYSITMDCVPPSQRSRWAALNSLRSLSFSASAVLGGYLADHYGYQFSFSVTVISLLVCTLLILPAWIWFPRKEGSGNEQALNLLNEGCDSQGNASPGVGVASAPSRPL